MCASIAARPMQSADQIERKLWSAWMASLSDPRVLDNDVIGNHLAPKGTGMLDFGASPSHGDAGGDQSCDPGLVEGDDRRAPDGTRARDRGAAWAAGAIAGLRPARSHEGRVQCHDGRPFEPRGRLLLQLFLFHGNIATISIQGGRGAAMADLISSDRRAGPASVSPGSLRCHSRRCMTFCAR